MTTLEDRYVVDVFSWKELSFQVTEEKSYMNTAYKIGPLKKHKEVTEGEEYSFCVIETPRSIKYISFLK